MGQVIDIKNLKADLLNLKKQGEIYPINNDKFAIKHAALEKLAHDYSVETEPFLQSCNLEKGCVVVKAVAVYRKKKYFSFGEVSPLNNDFEYPVAVAEKRAIDRSILKALGIHGDVYSDQELSNKKNTNYKDVGVDLNKSSVILELLKNVKSLAHYEELKSKNGKYITELSSKDPKKYEQLKKAFLYRKQQLVKG